jgi:hypothetical protein
MAGLLSVRMKFNECWPKVFYLVQTLKTYCNLNIFISKNFHTSLAAVLLDANFQCNKRCTALAGRRLLNIQCQYKFQTSPRFVPIAGANLPSPSDSFSRKVVFSMCLPVGAIPFKRLATFCQCFQSARGWIGIFICLFHPFLPSSTSSCVVVVVAVSTLYISGVGFFRRDLAICRCDDR